MNSKFLVNFIYSLLLVSAFGLSTLSGHGDHRPVLLAPGLLNDSCVAYVETEEGFLDRFFGYYNYLLESLKYKGQITADQQVLAMGLLEEQIKPMKSMRPITPTFIRNFWLFVSTKLSHSILIGIETSLNSIGIMTGKLVALATVLAFAGALEEYTHIFSFSIGRIFIPIGKMFLYSFGGGFVDIMKQASPISVTFLQSMYASLDAILASPLVFYNATLGRIF